MVQQPRQIGKIKVAGTLLEDSHQFHYFRPRAGMTDRKPDLRKGIRPMVQNDDDDPSSFHFIQHSPANCASQIEFSAIGGFHVFCDARRNASCLHRERERPAQLYSFENRMNESGGLKITKVNPFGANEDIFRADITVTKGPYAVAMK